MISKRINKIGIAALAVILMFSIVIIAISASDDTVASARVTQGHIDRLRGEKRQYERQKREIQEKIDTYEFERMEEMSKKLVLDERIMLTGLEIANTNEIIDQFTILIREKEYEVVLAQNRENTQLERYRNRVRDMEENGIISYLEIVFDSTSFSDLLARIDFVGDIMRADATLYDNLQLARGETEAAKEDLELTKEELEEEKIALELMEVELNEQLDEAHAIIIKLNADIETEQALHDEVTAEEERVQRAISAAVKELARLQELERQRQRAAQQATAGGSNTAAAGGETAAASAPVSGSGQLGWPMGGSVISRFGMRSGRMHWGLDIGAPHGASVNAADSGTVITVSHGAGYGHYIVISHGNGITTLYAHLSGTSVSVGQSVAKGQHIGSNGSSGNATTPHVHFEVTVNGTRVDPLTVL